MSESMTPGQAPYNDGCLHCRLDFDFVMPQGLPDAAHRRQLVIFAGAGISTEVATVFPKTVLEIAAGRLGIEEPESFPETLQAFQDRFGRSELVRMEGYAKPSLKKCRPIAARNEDKKVFSGRL